MDQNAKIFGVRNIVPFRYGSFPSAQILRPSNNMYPLFTDEYSDFLRIMPVYPIKFPMIKDCFQSEAVVFHRQTRNRLIYQNNLLFEANGATVRIIHDPLDSKSWKNQTDSIATRSHVLNFSINPAASFGIGVTQNHPFIFSLQNQQFQKVSYFKVPTFCFDIKTSPFLEGESVGVTSAGDIIYLDKTRVVRNLTVSKEPFGCAAVEYTGHPRVILSSTLDEVFLFDLRLPEPVASATTIPVAQCSSISLLSSTTFSCASPHGIEFHDLRFPDRPTLTFSHAFRSPVVSSCYHKLADFDTLMAHCAASSQVVFFPYTDTTYAAPISPFEATLRQYLYEADDFLTGCVCLDERNVLLQFESGAIAAITMDPKSMPCYHLFSALDRNELEYPADFFVMRPKLAKIPVSSDANNDWIKGFSDIDIPPDIELYEGPSPPPHEEVGDGYLCDLEEALEMDNGTIDQALPLFWENHLKFAQLALADP